MLYIAFSQYRFMYFIMLDEISLLSRVEGEVRGWGRVGGGGD